MDKKHNKIVLPKNPVWNRLARQNAIAVLGEDWENLADRKDGDWGIHFTIGENGVAWSPSNCVHRFLIVSLFHDRPNDRADGTPAMMGFYRNGDMESRVYLTKGKTNDPNNSVPAYVQYYPDLSIKCVGWYKDGERCDSAYGHPAHMNFTRNGQIDHAYSTIHPSIRVKDSLRLNAAANDKMKSDALKSYASENTVMARSGHIIPGSTKRNGFTR